MRIRSTAAVMLIGFLAGAAPAFADSVAVTSGPNGTVIVIGRPCRVVTRDGRNSSNTGSTSNSTSITTGPNGLSATTTISPGANTSSVTVGSGSTSNGTQSSSAAGSDCVIYRNEPAK